MPTCPINITLSNGAKMPALGLGTYRAPNEEDLINAYDKALEVGYRHFDTATLYQNEKVLGKVLKTWTDSGKVRREDLFIVTKLPSIGNRASSVEKFLKQSMEYLQVDYIDLYLIHSPVGLQDIDGDLHPRGADGKVLLDPSTDLAELWKGMEAQVDAGRARAIGLSNFREDQIQRVLDTSRIKPACLQVELHAYFQQKPLIEFCRQNNIGVVAYAPLGSPGMVEHLKKIGQEYSVPSLMNHETVVSIATKHKKSPANILIRHILQRGVCAIPRSTKPQRVASNFQVFDFELDDADMKAMDTLDQGAEGRGFSFRDFGLAEHPECPF